MIPKYRIRCVGGGEIIPDLTAQSCLGGHDSLLRTEYCRRRLYLAPYTGIFRYLCWLPVTRPLLPSGGPVTFAADGLARELGLSRLFISFSGYSPEHHAALATGSFKELEALPTMQRLSELGGRIPVIASAGNTAGPLPGSLRSTENRWSWSSRNVQSRGSGRRRQRRMSSLSRSKGITRMQLRSVTCSLPSPVCAGRRGKECRPPGRDGDGDARCGSHPRTDSRSLFPGGRERDRGYRRVGGGDTAHWRREIRHGAAPAQPRPEQAIHPACLRMAAAPPHHRPGS